MEGFENGKALRLLSKKGKYLVAEENGESVTLNRNESADGSIWTIELTSNDNNNNIIIIRFKSCYDKYLIASSRKSGLRGRKVIQSLPSSNSSADWILKGDKDSLKLETASKSCLRANGGLPPWRDTVTHKKPFRSPTNKAYIWKADFLDGKVRRPAPGRRRSQPSRGKVISGNIKDAAVTGSALVGAGAVLQGVITTSTQEENGEEERDPDNEGDEAAGDSEYEDDDEDDDEDEYERWRNKN